MSGTRFKSNFWGITIIFGLGFFALAWSAHHQWPPWSFVLILAVIGILAFVQYKRGEKQVYRNR